MDILKGIQQKDAGCINLGLSKQSISNYFRDIGKKMLQLMDGDCTVSKIKGIYQSLDDDDDEDEEYKILIEDSIMYYNFPKNGTPPIHLPFIVDAMVIREGKKSNLGNGVDRKQFSVSVVQLSKHMSEQMTALVNDMHNGISDTEREVLRKKAAQLLNFKASMSTMRRYKINSGSNMNCNADHKKMEMIFFMMMMMMMMNVK